MAPVNIGTFTVSKQPVLSSLKELSRLVLQHPAFVSSTGSRNGMLLLCRGCVLKSCKLMTYINNVGCAMIIGWHNKYPRIDSRLADNVSEGVGLNTCPTHQPRRQKADSCHKYPDRYNILYIQYSQHLNTADAPLTYHGGTLPVMQMHYIGLLVH